MPFLENLLASIFKSLGPIVSNAAKKTVSNTAAKTAAKVASKTVAQKAAKSAAKNLAKNTVKSVAKTAAKNVAKTAAKNTAKSVAQTAAKNAAKNVAKSAVKGVAKTTARSVALKAPGKLAMFFAKNPEAKKQLFKAGGSGLAGLLGLGVLSGRHKLEEGHARELEDIKTKGYEDRLKLRNGEHLAEEEEVQQLPTSISEGATFNDISKKAGDLPSPIIPEILYPGDMCTLAGENHAGKSALLYHIGLCLAQAKPLNLTEESPVPAGKYEVIMYDRENTNRTLKKRYGDLDVNNLIIVRGKEFKTIDNLLDDLELRLGTIESGSNVLACIDNATAFKMPTTGAKITDFYTRLQTIIDDAEEEDKTLTVIIAVHLSSKAESKKDDSKVLGATQILSSASANLFIKNTRFGKKMKILKATKNRLEDWPEQAFLLQIDDTAPWSFMFEGMVNEEDVLPQRTSQSKKESSGIPPSKPSSCEERSSIQRKSDESKATGQATEASQSDTPAAETQHDDKNESITHDVRCKFTDEDIRAIIRRKDAGERIEDIAKEKGTSMKTLYKWINKYREGHPEE